MTPRGGCGCRSGSWMSSSKSVGIMTSGSSQTHQGRYPNAEAAGVAQCASDIVLLEMRADLTIKGGAYYFVMGFRSPSCSLLRFGYCNIIP